MLLSLSNEIKSEYFLDRDPELFRVILQWYRTGSLYLPKDMPREIIESELEFYGIPLSEISIVPKILHLSGKKVKLTQENAPSEIANLFSGF